MQHQFVALDFPTKPEAARRALLHSTALGLARDQLDARNRIDNNRATITDAIKAVWRAYLDDEIDEGEAERRDHELRNECPPSSQAARRVTAPPIPRPRRRPDLAERRQHARKLAFSGPMPPRLACMFTVSQLAVLNIYAGEFAEKGACRLTIKEIADRSETCRRTVQNTNRQARLCGLLEVRQRRLSGTMNLPNIVMITSKEWFLWVTRRGAWMRSTRIENKGAKCSAPQVQYTRKREATKELKPRKKYRRHKMPIGGLPGSGRQENWLIEPSTQDEVRNRTPQMQVTGSRKVSPAAPAANSRLVAKRSVSVMARRREPPRALDFFPTPPWATRALFRHVLPAIGIDTISSVWEPACGEGHMAAVVAEFVGSSVTASDIFDYGYGLAPVDFLNDPRLVCPKWIITNPPFSAACEFTLRALDLATEGVAMLVRTQWVEGIGRYEKLFRDRPPSLYAPFVERVPMVKGRWDPDATTATSYAWFV